MTERDFDTRPYSTDEQRVAAFLAERGAGGGDDPIGFILASYALVIEERNAVREAAEDVYGPWSCGEPLDREMRELGRAIGMKSDPA